MRIKNSDSLLMTVMEFVVCYGNGEKIHCCVVIVPAVYSSRHRILFMFFFTLSYYSCPVLLHHVNVIHVEMLKPHIIITII